MPDDPLDLIPEARDRLRELERAVWAPGRVDPAILEACRARVAELLGDRAQPRRPERPVSDRVRVCLEFAELYVIDAHAITDEISAAVRSELGDVGATAFAMAIAVFDATSRFRVAMEVS